MCFTPGSFSRFNLVDLAVVIDLLGPAALGVGEFGPLSGLGRGLHLRNGAGENNQGVATFQGRGQVRGVLDVAKVEAFGGAEPFSPPFWGERAKPRGLKVADILRSFSKTREPVRPVAPVMRTCRGRGMGG